jgi:uncharacterized protein YndB with AHSA1/START domain
VFRNSTGAVVSAIHTMARNTIYIDAPVENVYATLLDPYCYPGWVVGTKKIRSVDPEWPEPGSSFHHKVRVAGRDRSEMLAKEPNKRVDLKVFARPLLVAVVGLQIAPEGSGTRFWITEEPAPDTAMRRLRYLIDPIVHVRNAVGLKSLKKLVEERASAGS